MRLAVLGAGNGGCGITFDWAAAGHEVAIYANRGHFETLGS